jgi:CheY-like chemotaxis protein
VKLRILHLEDNLDDAELVRITLKRQNLDCDIHAVSTGDAYLSALQSHKFDVILSDSGLPGYNGADALAAAQAHCPNVPFIVISGHTEPFEDCDAVQQIEGVAACISKTDLKRLAPAIVAAVDAGKERAGRRG